ncbi:MAG: polysaccharide deacetylase family protein [Bacteroidales bacterium]|nr:polysaccharide deacetylase family protein [Bacteroidales bacterium]
MPNDSSKVFLTFDDGPIPNVTEWVLDTLKYYNIKGTFFCVGENVKKYPEIFQRIKKEGHAIGCHTFNHLNGWTTPSHIYLDNIIESEKFIHTSILRPPYGKIKLSLAKQLRNSYKIIMWDVLTKDYDNNVTPEECFQTVVNQTSSGSIIVFHDSLKAQKNLKDSLPKSIEYLLNKGFKLDKIAF